MPHVIGPSLLPYPQGALYPEVSLHYSSGVVPEFLDRVTVVQWIPGPSEIHASAFVGGS